MGINHTHSHQNGIMIDRIGGSNKQFTSKVTREILHGEGLETEEVRTEHNAQMNYTKLSSLISKLQNLLERFGDGYVISGSNEMTSEFFGISVVKETIEFEGLKEGTDIIENQFFSID